MEKTSRHCPPPPHLSTSFSLSTLFLLFLELFKISLFIIGGGYTIIAAADQTFAKKGWTKEGELLDHLPIFQMIPGLIATHTAVYVGRKVAGRLGAAVGVLAVALPSIIIFTGVAMGYQAIPLGNPYLESAFVGLRSALTGIIAATIIRGWKKSLPDAFAYGVGVAALAALLAGVAVPWVLAGAMILGVGSGCRGAKEKKTSSALHLRLSTTPIALLLFLKYGALCFGGGFVLVPMYIEDFVGPTAHFLQITTEEFANLMALTQMTPGPIGVNGATYFGFQLAGIPGAVLASIFLLLPGSLLAYLAFASLERFQTSRIVRGILRGVKPASVALMLVALVAFAKMSVFGRQEFNTIALIIAIICTLMTMKKKLNVVLLVVLASLAATAVRADEVTVERFPDADSVLVDSLSKITYKPDGSYEEISESWTKILTEKGRRDESVISMRYSKRYGNAEILYVGAIGTNGVERVIDISKTTKESTDNSSMSVNIYDPLDRRIVCTIPNLKVGETVHTKTRSAETKARCEGVWSDINVFEWSCPILKSTVEITAPKELPLKKKTILNPLGNVTATEKELADGSILHTWVATNSPQCFPEPAMPRLFTEVQHMRVSTAETWEELSQWYWNLCLPHIMKTTPAMTNKVEEVLVGLKDDDAKIRAIFKFVSQEIRYMGLTMEDTSPGYAPHDIDVTFDNRYGVCRDKAGLLVALLRIAGFEAYPVLIHVAEKIDPSVPRPFFNHAIVAVDRGSRSYMLMDPTNENAKDLFPAYESDKSYLVARPDGETLLTTPIPTAEHNQLKVNSHARLAQDGSMFLENEIFFNGINDSVYRESFVKMTSEARTKFFERVVRAVAPGAELVRCSVEPENMLDTETPIRVVLSSRLPEAVLPGETCGELMVPFVTRALGMANFILNGNTALEKRRFKLTLDSTASVCETIEIELNGALGAVKELPGDEAIQGGYNYNRSFRYADGKLTAHRCAAVTSVEFTPEEYAQLREDIKRTEAAERKRPVFFNDRTSGADVRWRLESTEVDIFGPHSWVSTNRIEKEILTYEGKKSSAELKFSYNPAIQDLKLLSASVRNKDGTEYAVSEKEINVMDCGWAAAAPRYPAGKLLVVNLPSVEIGSTISYTLVNVMTNAPASFYTTFGFDAKDPLDRRYVRLNDWTREVINPRRIPNEPGQPYSSLWRDQLIVSSNDFSQLMAEFRAADDAAVGTDAALEAALETIAKEEQATLVGTNGVVAIRNWMTKHVSVAGPSLWELPFKDQFTSPDVILAERYATRVDYVRTLAALYRAAGYEADVVLAGTDAAYPEDLRKRTRYEKPNAYEFAHALCRVTVKSGGFLGFFRDSVTYFVGTENEYLPLGICAYQGNGFLDPSTAEFGTVIVPQDGTYYYDYTSQTKELEVRENGGVDMVVKTVLWGNPVGAFRKQYAEILPEDRNRLHQKILGSIAQAATATGELEADITSYPARREFKCFVPDYATVAGDTITLQLPALISTIPNYAGKVRRTPFAVAGAGAEDETYVIRFPEGYTEIEHLPQSFTFANPYDSNFPWLVAKVASRIDDDGRLVVEIRRDVKGRTYSWYYADFIELIRDRNRIAASRANRTIVVRKTVPSASSRTGAGK